MESLDLSRREVAYARRISSELHCTESVLTAMQVDGQTDKRMFFSLTSHADWQMCTCSMSPQNIRAEIMHTGLQSAPLRMHALIHIHMYVYIYVCKYIVR
jgi:hypothetical protein